MANQRQPFRHQQEEWSVPRRYGAAGLHVTCNRSQDQLCLSLLDVPEH